MHCPKNSACCVCSSHCTLPTQTLAINALSTISIVLPFPGCHITEITYYIAFSEWLLSLTNWHLNFFHIFPWLPNSFFFQQWKVFLYLNVPQFIYSITNWIISKFGQLWIKVLKHSCESFCIDISFLLLWVTNKKHNCWIVWWWYV